MTDNQSKSVNPNQSGTKPEVSQVDDFLADLKRRRTVTSAAPPTCGRLVFGLDATASRQPTWDAACQLQGEMFREAIAVGGLELQLVYYRGISECRSSRWFSDSAQLAKTMSQIMCNAGTTQIRKILTHTQKETKLMRVSALVFVGDAVEESADILIHEAAELRRLRVPAFMFQEGCDRTVEQTFRTIAHLTKGAYCRFDPGAALQLAELLRAVAVFAAGGAPALAARKDAGASLLLGQMR